VIADLVGALDYAFRTYTILSDPGAARLRQLRGGAGARRSGARVHGGDGQHGALLRHQRRSDTSDVVLDPAAFDRRSPRLRSRFET
jgi:hypothetical protein